MLRRIINWFLYDVLIGIMPVGVAFVFRELAKKVLEKQWPSQPQPLVDAELPEILFFIIVLNITAIRDINNLTKPIRLEGTFNILKSAQMICAVGASIFYGGLRFARFIDPNLSLPLFMYISVGIVIIFWFVAGITQVLISISEQQLC